MHRLLRLVMLWLIVLALPLQGALAASAMSAQAAARVQGAATMTMPDGRTMDAAAMPGAPCHGHATDKAGGCGDCCGPIVAQQAMLAVAPVASRWSALPRAPATAGAWHFLTGGTDRPPRPVLA